MIKSFLLFKIVFYKFVIVGDFVRFFSRDFGKPWMSRHVSRWPISCKLDCFDTLCANRINGLRLLNIALICKGFCLPNYLYTRRIVPSFLLRKCVYLLYLGDGDFFLLAAIRANLQYSLPSTGMGWDFCAEYGREFLDNCTVRQVDLGYVGWIMDIVQQLQKKQFRLGVGTARLNLVSYFYLHPFLLNSTLFTPELTRLKPVCLVCHLSPTPFLLAVIY